MTLRHRFGQGSLLLALFTCANGCGSVIIDTSSRALAVQVIPLAARSRLKRLHAPSGKKFRSSLLSMISTAAQATSSSAEHTSTTHMSVSSFASSKPQTASRQNSI